MPGHRGTIVVAGALAQRPGRGGHAWVFLQYLLGFRRLGWDVLFLDRLDASTSLDARGVRCPPRGSLGAAYLDQVMRAFGLEDCYSLLCEGETIGVPRATARRLTRDAALLINVMGYLEDEDMLGAASRRVFLDIDPGFPQLWRALGLHDGFRGHEDLVTVGRAIGDQGCAIPTGHLDWIPTLPPVVLEHWPVDARPGDAVTGIGAWRGPNRPVEYQGRTYGLRVHEFRALAALASRCGQSCHYALEIDPGDEADADHLRAHGWRLLDPRLVADTPSAYRDFVSGSMAEIMVAKSMYVTARSGWFSDRSACYLASGRPVIAQDTGRCLPAEAGLLTFTNLEEADAAVREVVGDYPRHRRAARAVAEDHLDSDLVLTGLLRRLRVA